jgi:hypothetical protein
MAMKRYAAERKREQRPPRTAAEESEHARPVGTYDLPAARSLDALPGTPAARALRQGTVQQMQQHQGNAYVQRALELEVQREDEERPEQAPVGATQTPTEATQAPSEALQAPAETTEAPTAATQAPSEALQAPAETSEAPTEAAGQGSAISDGGSSVRADAGGVTIDGARLGITAGMVSMDAPLVTTSGIIRTQTIIAENVVGTTYTPGVGNVQ